MEFPSQVYQPPTYFHDSLFRSRLEPEIQLQYESGGSGQNSNQGMDLNGQGSTNSSYPGNHHGGNRQSLNRTDINVAIDESYCVVENGKSKWRCNVCYKIYTTKHNLVTHVLGHAGVRPYVCTVCNKAFKQMVHLTAHKLTHAGNKCHKCPICKRSFLRLIYVKRHMLTHANRHPYMCHLCPEGFAHSQQLEAHLDKHKQLPGGYQQQQNSSNHRSSTPRGDHHHHHHHSSSSSSSKKQGDLRCDVCGRIFLYPSQLKDHMLSHAQVRPYRCEICGMRFIKDHHLKAHQITHTDERPHKCPVCNRGFSLKGNMIRHTLVHQQQRNYECEVCTKKFSQPQTLKMHMVVHADQKPYTCEICGKALARAHNLRSHMALHRSVKPHQCQLCGSAFTMRGNLQRHFKEKHKSVIPPPTINMLPPGYPLHHNGASSSSFSHDPDYKRRKTSPKKLHAKKRKVMQHSISKRLLCPQVLIPSGPYISVPQHAPGSIMDKHCARQYLPIPSPMVSHHFAPQLPQQQQGEDLVGKIKELHTAIDDLAGKCGQSPEKAARLHAAIDEMATKQAGSSQISNDEMRPTS